MAAGRLRVVAVSVELVEHVTGLWCDRCLLPSGYKATVAITQGGRMHLQDRLWCPQHGGGRGVRESD